MWAVEQNDERYEKDGVALPSERKCTNFWAIIFCAIFVIVMFGFVAYSGSKSDLDRIIKGYDDCGNVCGKNNPENTFDFCGSHDKTPLPKVLVTTKEVKYNVTHNITQYNYQCVEKCDKKNYVVVFNRCYKVDRNNTGNNQTDDDDINTGATGFLDASIEGLSLAWPGMIGALVVAFIFSYILLVLFRHAAKYIIWIITIGNLVVLFGAAIAFFVMGLIIPGIVFLVAGLLSALLVWWFRDRIKLVAKLFKETSKVLMDIPAIMFEPILTFLALTLSAIPFVYFLVLIQSAGYPKEMKNLDKLGTHVVYAHDAAMSVAMVLNFLAYLWFSDFVIGCQHFVIGGTVSKWYFTRDKSKLTSPILSTFDSLVRFHLGSICLGAMLLTLVKVIRMIAQAIKDSSKEGAMRILACICEWIIETLEKFIRYLVRNAYIIVAKDGTPLIESGKRAFTLLFNNLMDVIALNRFGDIVLVIGQFFVVVIAALVGYVLMDKPTIPPGGLIIPMILTCIFAFFIANCFITVFEMSVDTIFLCFCDDCERNDGVTKPYYMSESLMRTMQEMKGEAGGQFNFGQFNNSNMESGRMM